MYRIKQSHMEEIEIKKSRFLCYLYRVFCEEEAKALIQQVRKEHPNANHHCYAFIIGEHNEIQRSNDDGEPAGTAGVPMLECLAARNMQDVLAITVRYFGGVKLGAGGLIRAYNKSVVEALNHVVITKKTTMHIYDLRFPYAFIGRIDYFFRTKQIEIIAKTYDDVLVYTFMSSQPVDREIAELTSGSCLPEYRYDKIVEVTQSTLPSR